MIFQTPEPRPSLALTATIRSFAFLASPAGLPDFAHDEDRAIAVDLDAAVGIAQVAATQFLRDQAFELLQRAAARRNLADQREGDVAGLVDRVGIGQPFLLEDGNAQAVAGIERIGLDRRLVESLVRGLVGRAAGQDCRRRGLVQYQDMT